MTKYRTWDIDIFTTEYLANDYSHFHDDKIVQAFVNATKGESDRGLVLISAAFLDDLLEGRMRHLLRKGNNSARNKLFDAVGPFSSVSAKIETLFCFGDISKDIRDDLNIIRKLRNDYAHEWQDFTLLEPKNRDCISKLKNTSLFNSVIKAGDTLPIHPKTTFSLVVISLISCLNILPSKAQ